MTMARFRTLSARPNAMISAAQCRSARALLAGRSRKRGFLLYKKTGSLRDYAKVAVLATFVDRDWRLRCPLCGFAAKKS
jgi:hypothetical protein